MGDIPFTTGSNAPIRLFLGSAAAPGSPAEIVSYAKTWTVKPNVTKINDGIGGEDRDRLNVVVNFFELGMQCAIRDAKMINAILANILNNDQSLAPFAAAAGIKLKIRDGSKAVWILRDLVVDDFEIGQKGRDQTMMNNVNARFRYFDPGPSV